MIIYGSKVKAILKAKDKMCSKEYLAALDRLVEKEIERHITNANQSKAKILKAAHITVSTS